MRTAKELKNLSDEDREYVLLASEMWAGGPSEKAKFREYEAEMRSLEHQGYTRKGREMRAVYRKYLGVKEDEKPIKLVKFAAAEDLQIVTPDFRLRSSEALPQQNLQPHATQQLPALKRTSPMPSSMPPSTKLSKKKMETTESSTPLATPLNSNSLMKPELTGVLPSLAIVVHEKLVPELKNQTKVSRSSKRRERLRRSSTSQQTTQEASQKSTITISQE